MSIKQLIVTALGALQIGVNGLLPAELLPKIKPRIRGD
jgi:hypothetical protein